MSQEARTREREELVARYKRFRAVSRRLSKGLVRAIPKTTLRECARKLGILQGGVLVFDTEHETAVLADYCIHSHRVGGKTVLEWHLASSPPPPGSDEMLVLQAMRKSRYSIFVVTRVDRGLGMELEDAFAGDTLFLIDLGLSQTAFQNCGFATRLVPLPGFWMTTGSALPITPGVVPEIERRVIARFGPERAKNLENLSPLDQSTLATIVIQTCLRAGVSQYVRYEEPP
jgi:hypothetical protein